MKTVRLIANPVSGGKDKTRIVETVREVLQEASFQVEVCWTARPGHATQLAREADASIVAAVGGDGTVSEVAQGLIGTGKVLGIIPCGSGDGLALHLGISRNPRKAALALARGRVQTMDYGTVSGRPFFCTAGVGLDAIVAWKFARGSRRGIWQYISLAWKTWQDFHPETYTVDIDGQRIRTPAVFITVGNANQWGNQARITSLASAGDGLLDVTVVEPFRTVEIPRLAAKLMLGRAHTSRRAHMYRGKKIIISRPEPGPAHYDGDPCEMGTEIEVKVVPSALQVLVPEGKRI